VTVRQAAYVHGVLRRLRPLSEAECYARCYGAGDDTVRLVDVQERRLRRRARLTGEEVRRLFESRLDTRESAAA
jgi:hypothetical protein